MNRTTKRRISSVNVVSCGVSVEALEVRSLLSGINAAPDTAKVYVVVYQTKDSDNQSTIMISEQPDDAWLELGAWLYTDRTGLPRLQAPIFTIGRRGGFRETLKFDPDIYSRNPSAFEHVTVSSYRSATEVESNPFEQQKHLLSEQYNARRKAEEAARPRTQEEIFQETEEALQKRFGYSYRPDRMPVAEYPWLMDLPEELPELGIDPFTEGPRVYGYDWSTIDNSEFDWSQFENAPWSPFFGLTFHPARPEPKPIADEAIVDEPESDVQEADTEDAPEVSRPVHDLPKLPTNRITTEIPKEKVEPSGVEHPSRIKPAVDTNPSEVVPKNPAGQTVGTITVTPPAVSKTTITLKDRQIEQKTTRELTPADFVGVSIFYQPGKKMNSAEVRMSRRERQEQAVLLEQLYMKERLAEWLNSVSSADVSAGKGDTLQDGDVTQPLGKRVTVNSTTKPDESGDDSLLPSVTGIPRPILTPFKLA